MDLKALEQEAEGFLAKVTDGLKIAQSSAAVQKIADEFPAAKALLENAIGAVPVLGEIEAGAKALIALYTLGAAFGMKPMDANQMAEDEKKFHEGYSAD